MHFIRTRGKYNHVMHLITLYLFTQLITIILCNKSRLPRKGDLLNYKCKKKLELYIHNKKKGKGVNFIYYHNNIYKRVQVDEREYKLSDDLKNIILLFGRIAKHYYPNTVEQFHFFKEPYSKYIYTKENINSTKWKHVFKNNEIINKNIFYQKICQLKFKWPINQDENITEYNFYNLVIEKCLNNINMVKSNIHNLKILLSKIVESKEGKDRVDGKDSKRSRGKNPLIRNLYDELEKELLTNVSESAYDASHQGGSEQSKDKEIKLLEKLENLQLSDIFKQHNRSYSRQLVNEVFNREYPSKKTTDIFLYLLFQKNVEEFSYEHFLKNLNKLGKKMELFNCNYNSNIYFDHFYFLMKSEMKKNSIQLKKKRYAISPSAKVVKTNREHSASKTYESKHDALPQNEKKKKKHDLLITSQSAMHHQFGKMANAIPGEVKLNAQHAAQHVVMGDTLSNANGELQNDHLQDSGGCTRWLNPKNTSNEKGNNQGKKKELVSKAHPETGGNKLKNKLISVFNYIVNRIKKGF
ncbi:conserved Plasmodium protein, unknown function [Plasmodium ovale]|uniref:Uncharacterized protein n=1 Tax=Plasmodium ovale TaxID=36330 RepID=A0A1D3TGK7_PLAOA|nr:conserved Plasmodium protein, unknown function [Plasmodium ovale]